MMESFICFLLPDISSPIIAKDTVGMVDPPSSGASPQPAEGYPVGPPPEQANVIVCGAS